MIMKVSELSNTELLGWYSFFSDQLDFFGEYHEVAEKNNEEADFIETKINMELMATYKARIQVTLEGRLEDIDFDSDFPSDDISDKLNF